MKYVHYFLKVKMRIWRNFPIIICTLFFMLAWSGPCHQGCHGGDVPREAVLEFVKRKILEGLNLEKPPDLVMDSSAGEKLHRVRQHGAHRERRDTRVERRHNKETSQIIMFPSSDPMSSSLHATYNFQPSSEFEGRVITSVDFWFYSGVAVAVNVTSMPLYILTSGQELHQVAQRPFHHSPDGWTTYRFKHHFHGSVSNGPFMLQVRCPTCSCDDSAEDRTPFLHVHVRRWENERTRRALNIAWSPDVIERLQRPSTEKHLSDCKREQIEISFEELGWESWIVHPKSFSFFYCDGNCLSPERAATMLGIHQCCAPVPESMKSLRFTTTSDGGFSFKYETLPNIIPEECNCM